MRELAGELRDEGDEGAGRRDREKKKLRKKEKKLRNKEEREKSERERERIGNVYLIGEEREL